MAAPKNLASSRETATHADGYGHAGQSKHAVLAPADIVGGQTGWGAADLVSAYNIPTSLLTRSAIGLLVANDNPNLESDLQVYRAQYGLPACTGASGCLRVVTAPGAPTPVRADADIAESSLEVQVASATCPNCKLVVVAASSDPTRGPTLEELGSAAKAAVAQGATVLVTGYGASELDENGAPWAPPYEQLFPTGVSLFAAAGSGGYASQDSPAEHVGLPAAYPQVTAVGGTTLTKVTPDVSSRRWTESVSPTSASGCSLTQKTPAFQSAGSSGGSGSCGGRTVVDVSASSDPFLTYFTDPATADAADATTQAGWHAVGGTGESAAIIAGVFAATSQDFRADPQYSYANPDAFFDVTSGRNGSCGSGLCAAQPGFDGASGNGSPDGEKLEGVYISISPANVEMAANSHDGVVVQTTGVWAMNCTSLGWSVSGLPAGVSSTFVKNVVTRQPPPPVPPPISINLKLTADLDAPAVPSSRVEVSAHCDGVIHTTSFFLDLVACKPISCFFEPGINVYCGTVSDQCFGTVDCPEACSGAFTCDEGLCVCPPGVCAEP